ncbi:MAG: tRNA (adenosine(37)-N6)-threonylcarbamoyltransferase complex transferase subunit TsaD [Rickettsiaceae bacterium]|nr:tRNA (adenosine(37)-N6)-threonylcarbamoyltransferase complex transferase subunit TsaD [Rickettsiaceae bacterium]
MRKLVLGIESSCDDTSVAIVTSEKDILSNIIISQIEEHSPYMGVVPEIAARSHMLNLRGAFREALLTAKVSLEDLDAIAFTGGPGLIGGVIVGTMFAKGLASVTKKPLIAVNHLEGHALTVRLTNDIGFPYLLLLASGGHCQFVQVDGVGHYKILGRTLDDAIGEAFDKTAKMLGLGYPGGPIIEKLALKGDHRAYSLPFPMVSREGCDMSFSGLKTAVRILIEDLKDSNKLDDKAICDICASFQYTVSEILSRRLINAISKFLESAGAVDKRFVISGGVAANQYIKSRLQGVVEKENFEIITPPIKLCTDNAAMIAWAGVERFRLGKLNDLSFCPRARWSLEEL